MHNPVRCGHQVLGKAMTSAQIHTVTSTVTMPGVLGCVHTLHLLSLQGDLTDPSSLPACLVGVSTVIDCATARPEESTDKVDWQGKVALIQSAQVREHAGDTGRGIIMRRRHACTEHEHARACLCQPAQGRAVRDRVGALTDWVKGGT